MRGTKLGALDIQQMEKELNSNVIMTILRCEPSRIEADIKLFFKQARYSRLARLAVLQALNL